MFGRAVPSPELVAAGAAVGLIHVERVPLWAAHWLAGGLGDSDALVVLAALDGTDGDEVRAVLPQALASCGVTPPDTVAEAADVLFTHFARLFADGLVDEREVAERVGEIALKTSYDDGLVRLPLGRTSLFADEWGEHWGQDETVLAAEIRRACAAQLEPH
ncbi:hypothetical protein [Amycolatopsis sp. CA-230715]|uniref:hypothetical protein n=1 Tax=Amycolatopsis sp. CA-230715 TaxID=2745196 RepID=UPI001C025D48|nr:hypothetical protein [Amycolatopsis sp. CA-230715]QWF79986.1 hypothetical protein HUW46_03400 [Amycolatopsis sp. CA-230715]